MRLDQFLVEQALAPTRSKARELIKSGGVRVDGVVVEKPAYAIARQRVEVTQERQYVSRAALKLKGFLPQLPFSPEGMYALDIGASTGGFCEVLLETGVRGVDAVDVGKDQLHPTLRADARVRNFEQTDIRRFVSERRYDLVTSDVSFISLHHILDDVDRLAARWIVLLFKPQFEVGREAKRDKKGVVTDERAIAKAQAAFEEACTAKGWSLIRHRPAGISGKEGNIEECYCFEKH